MRTLWIVPSLAVVLALAACVEEPTLDEDVAALKAKDRDKIAVRVRAQFASRGIVPIPPPPVIPGTTARRAALVELGRALLFDKILSDNKDISCMTCHPPAVGGDDDRHLSLGVRGTGLGPQRVGGLLIPRNAPPVFNLHAQDALFWDGRVERLPDGTLRTPAGTQLTPEMLAVFEFGALSAIGLFPVTNRDEMREHALDGVNDDLTALADGDFTGTWEALMVRLRAIPQYRTMFGAAYPSWPGAAGDRIDTMTFAHASNAMAAFLLDRFTSRDSAWDAFVAGDNGAFKELEEAGHAIGIHVHEEDTLLGAERFLATCANCHNGPTLSNNRFHNTALAQFGPGQGDGDGADDFGRGRVVTDLDADARCGLPGSGASCLYAFRTTPLRNVVFTAPYGHAGQIGRFGNDPDFARDVKNDFTDLRAFVAHYSVNPANNLRAYDVNQIQASLRPTLVANTDAIIAHIDPLFATGSPIVPGDIDILTAFMAAQTSASLFEAGLATRSSRRFAPCNSIPASVPSGLPVDGSPSDAYCP